MQGALFNMHILQPARVQSDAVCSYVNLCTIVLCLTLCVTCYIMQCKYIPCANCCIVQCTVLNTECVHCTVFYTQCVQCAVCNTECVCKKSCWILSSWCFPNWEPADYQSVWILGLDPSL